MNLPQPQSQLKQHLETLPKALQGAPRLRSSWPMNSGSSVCHWTGRRCHAQKWLLPPSKMLWLSVEERKETLAFIASTWSKMENTWKHCSTWQVNWKSQLSAWYHHRFFSEAIWLFATSSLKDLFRNLWASKSIKQDVRNLKTTTKMNLPQPQSQLKRHLETLPKALQGAPRLRSTLPMSWRSSTCHQTGRSCSLPKWLLWPSKMLWLSAKELEEIFTFIASRWSQIENTAPLGKWVGSHKSRHINTGSSAQQSDCLQPLL